MSTAIANALLSAFPKPGELRIYVRDVMDSQSFSSIHWEQDMKSLTGDIAERVVARGLVDRLLTVARQANPLNVDLRDVAASVGGRMVGAVARLQAGALDGYWEHALPEASAWYRAQKTVAAEQVDDGIPLHELILRLPEQAAPGAYRYPLLRLVHHLAGGSSLPVAVKRALREWIETTIAGVAGATYPTAQDLRDGLDGDAAAMPGGDRVLLVRMRPRPNTNPRMYSVQAWLYPPVGPGEPVLDEQSLPRDRLEGRVNELLLAAIEWVDPDYGLAVELMIPRELRSEAVERWRVEVSFGNLEPLAMEYPVVIRALERFEHPAVRRESVKRWRRLTGHGDACRLILAGHNADAAQVLPEGQTCAIAYWVNDKTVAASEFRRKILAHEAPVVACGILRHAPEADADHTREPLETLVNAGIPIVIWSRVTPGDERLLRAAVERLVDDATIGNLTNAVFQLRKAPPGDGGGGAAAADWRFGEHVVLLYDDAERLPEDMSRSTRTKGPNG